LDSDGENKRELESDVATCPASMTRTRSHCSTMRIECAMMMSVQSQNVCRIVSCIRVDVSESNDDVASSNTTIYSTAVCTLLSATAHGVRLVHTKKFSVSRASFPIMLLLRNFAPLN